MSSAACRRSVALAGLIGAIVALPLLPHPIALAQTPGSGVRLHAGNLVYLGAFRLPPPSGSGEQNTFEYGGEAMAFDPYRDSLWITGHDWHDRLAEVTIPTPSVTSPPVAGFKTPWIDMNWREAVGGAPVNMGGVLPLPNGDLILSAYVYYDAGGDQIASHVRRRANGSISSPARIGTGSADNVRYAAGFVSGWMLPVPAEWQPLLGAPALTGNGSLSIVSRTSLGPALATFDPSQVGVSASVSSTQLLAYPVTHPTLGTCETGTTFNCASSNRRAGMVWISGTRTLLYVHQQCEGGALYADGGWQCRGSRFAKVLAYDANDLLAVKNGSKQPWDVMPYAIWNLGAPLTRSRITAITYDSVRKWIFMAEDHGDGAQPLIHVYEVTDAPSASPAPFPSFAAPSAGLRRAGSHAGESFRRAGPRRGSSDGGYDGGDGDRERDAAGTTGQATATSPAAPARGATGMTRQRALARARSTTSPPRDPVAPRASAADARRASPGRVAECPGTNPFANSDGRIGVCVNGAWTLVPGIRTQGVVRHRSLAAGDTVWLLQTDEGVYEPAGGLDAAYQTDGLPVVFEGRFPSGVTRGSTGALIIEIRQINVVRHP